MRRDEGLQPTGCPGCLAASGLQLFAPALVSSSVSPLQEKEAALLGRAQQHWHLAFMCNFDGAGWLHPGLPVHLHGQQLGGPDGDGRTLGQQIGRAHV